MLTQECKDIVTRIGVVPDPYIRSQLIQLETMLTRLSDLERAASDFCRYELTDGSKSLAARERMREYFGT